MILRSNPACLDLSTRVTSLVPSSPCQLRHGSPIVTDDGGPSCSAPGSWSLGRFYRALLNTVRMTRRWFDWALLWPSANPTLPEVAMYIIARMILGVGILFCIISGSALIGELGHPKERPVLTSLVITYLLYTYDPQSP